MISSAPPRGRRLAARITPGLFAAAFAVVLAIGTLSSTFAHAGVGVWTSGGPYLGDIRALAINPVIPSTLYAGTSAGVFKSIDSGATWAAANTGLPPYYRTVYAIAINPATPSTLYAGTGYGVFRSTDSGSTWTAASKGPTNPVVFALAVNPAAPATIYAGTPDGDVFKSTDSGDTWIVVNTGLTRGDVHALSIDPMTPSTLYAALWATIMGDSGVYKSTDSGGTWAEARTGLTNDDVNALVINPTRSATLYTGTDGGIFKSSDSGRTWAAADASLPSLLVRALALDPTGATTLYAGLADGGVWQWTEPAEPTSFLGFVPTIVDVMGQAHYTSELQLTNLEASSTRVKLTYTSSIGSGVGDIMETIPAGQQVVYPDAISHLRTQDVPIPTSGNQAGTLFLASPTAGVHATVRTSADTVAPQPVGRAGLAYTDSDPAAFSSTKVYVYGLRTNDADRSNLAVYNMGQGPVSIKVTVVSGDDGSSFEVTAGVPLSLPAYGWYQYGDGNLLRKAGFSSGYAVIDRATGSGPFGAYGVINDQKTNDGSFIQALPGTQSGSKLTVPVIAEVGSFDSELILANRGSATATFTLRYVESLSPSKGAGGTTTFDVLAGRQTIISKAIDFLRSKGVAIGARGDAGYVGSLQVQVSGVGLENVFAGARTSSSSPFEGAFGVFYPGIDSSQEFSDVAFILGLKADANNRSNAAALHTGAAASGSITLEFQVLDGSSGGALVGTPLSQTLNPGEWVQPSKFFANGNVPNGCVRIRRTAGTAPWYAYGVINDGGNAGERTGDGAFVPGVK